MLVYQTLPSKRCRDARQTTTTRRLLSWHNVRSNNHVITVRPGAETPCKHDAQPPVLQAMLGVLHDLDTD